MQIRKRHSSGSTSEDRLAACAREYVESLHQNSRTRLLYGKNNVLVQPVGKLSARPHPLPRAPGKNLPATFIPFLRGLTKENPPSALPQFTDSCPALNGWEPETASVLAESQSTRGWEWQPAGSLGMAGPGHTWHPGS